MTSRPTGRSGQLNGCGEFGVCVVIADAELRQSVSAAFRYWGFTVTEANNSFAAVTEVKRAAAGTYIVGTDLPQLDGFEVCRRLRDHSDDFGIVLLSEDSGRHDVVRGLVSGADDVLTQPVNLQELMLRVAAISRRRQPTDPPSTLSYADLRVDPSRHDVERSGIAIRLTDTEFRLLCYLLLNAERVVSKAQILDRVWNDPYDRRDNLVETYVSYLRRKIDAQGQPLIHTIRGVGYVLRTEEPSLRGPSRSANRSAA